VFVLSVLGWISIVAGAFSAWVGYSEGNMFWVAMGISSAISGVLFLALDRGLGLLAQIRDAVAGAPSKKPFDAASYDEDLHKDEKSI
jgi:hypothetical protein